MKTSKVKDELKADLCSETKGQNDYQEGVQKEINRVKMKEHVQKDGVHDSIMNDMLDAIIVPPQVHDFCQRDHHKKLISDK